jgi:intracellular multiplication protein IcmG
MIDQDPNKNEEYHMDEANLMGGELTGESDIQTNPAATGEPPREPMSNPVLNQDLIKKIIVVCLGLLTIVLIARYVSYKKQLGAEQSKLVGIPGGSQNTTVNKSEPPPLSQPLIQQAPPPPPANATLSSEEKAKLDTVLQQEQDNQNQIQNLSQEVTQLQTSTQTLSNKMDDLITQLSAMTKKMEAQEEQARMLEQLKKKAVSSRVKANRHHPAKAAEKYYLQAAIPGRAWLIKRNGTDTLTVRRGTIVPGYGKVLQIDADKGRVLMSSGKTIIFGQWDS